MPNLFNCAHTLTDRERLLGESDVHVTLPSGLNLPDHGIVASNRLDCDPYCTETRWLAG